MMIDDLFEMSNISKDESGLPVRIWVSSKMSAAERHGPRIKVQMPDNGHPTVSILLKLNITNDDVVGYETIPSKILIPIREFINLNYDTLMKYWNDEISTKEMILSIKSI